MKRSTGNLQCVDREDARQRVPTKRNATGRAAINRHPAKRRFTEAPLQQARQGRGTYNSEGARRQSAVATRGGTERTAGTAVPTNDQEGGLQKPAFCETNPFVMLTKTHLYGSERMGCVHYRKMTNGFVFAGRRGRSRVWALCSLKIEAFRGRRSYGVTNS